MPKTIALMPIQRNYPEQTKFNSKATLPFELRLSDFAMAMQDVYDFFHDVNVGLVEKGLERLDDMVRAGDHVRSPF